MSEILIDAADHVAAWAEKLSRKPEPREPREIIRGKDPTDRNRALLGRALRKSDTP